MKETVIHIGIFIAIAFVALGAAIGSLRLLRGPEEVQPWRLYETDITEYKVSWFEYGNAYSNFIPNSDSCTFFTGVQIKERHNMSTGTWYVFTTPIARFKSYSLEKDAQFDYTYRRTMGADKCYNPTLERIRTLRRKEEL